MTADHQPETRLALAGLSQPGEIRIDRWGVPHIRAASIRDAFFLQGFNAARDRLWQIDLWRKRGLGLLAADFGPGYLAQDRASRLFLYRGDMAEEYAHYGPDAEAICTAFTAGINAAIDRIDAGEMALPETFTRFGTRPERWAPEDVVRIRIHCLVGNAISEFLRLRMLRVMGRQDGAIADQLRAPLSPDLPVEDWGPIADIDLPDEAIALYRLAIAPVSFQPARLAATMAEAEDWATTRDGRVVRSVNRHQGSNNWAVAASHTATGRPLMASDPHRAFTAPSLRYLVHLEAPGLSIIGAGEPSSPGIMAGHNGHAAFSMTYFPADQEDLMVLDLAEGGYRYDAGIQPFTEVSETIPVRGAEDQPVRLRFAGKAPVLWQNDRHALALRTIFTEPGSAPYMACLNSMRAQNADDFREALRGWGAPGSNQVYADVDGGLLWQAAAHVPKRRAGQAVVPVPGDGSADWQGFLDAADLPRIENPDCGFVHSSNEMNLPEDWDSRKTPIGREWYRDGRAERVAEVLAGAPTDVAASCALQTDVQNSLAARLCAALPAGVRGVFGDWQGAMTADSAEALLYAVWTARHLYPALIARLPEAAQPLIDEVEETAVVEVFEGHRPALAGLLGLGEADAREQLLRDTLDAALAACRERHGPDMASWRWGDLHQIRFTPAAGGPECGAFPIGGGIATVMMQAYTPPDFQSHVGASVRMVVDVGAWDESRWINAPGQAGDGDTRHGADLGSLWAEGGYFPMLYSAPAIRAATLSRWHLDPA